MEAYKKAIARVRTVDIRRLIITAMVSVIAAAAATFAYPKVCSIVFSGRTFDTSLHIAVIRFLLFASVLALVTACAVFGLRLTGLFLHRHRFALGIGVVIACVALDMNGSSLNRWNTIMGWDDQQGVIYGIPRGIRGDEFVVNTPRAFAQAYNGYGYFNSLLGAGAHPSDMFIIKDAPVWAFAEIFRPFHWGYLLLGSSRGLSFYWFVRLVALFLATYEFVLLLCSDRRKLAALGAVLVTFAPLTQWWFAVNSLPEMLIAVFLSIIMLNRYISDRNTWHRLGYTAVIFECAGMFALTLYPAWQIPLAYVLLVLIIWTCVTQRHEIKFTRIDVLNIVWVGALAAALMASVVYHSYPTIQAMLHTAYPGHRISTGGDFPLWYTFNGYASMLYPFKAYVGLFNASESAMVIDLFPLGLILFVIAEIRLHKRDLLSWLLTAYSLMCLAYMQFGFPAIIAKATLFAMTMPSRCYIAFALANILLLLRSLSRLPIELAAQRRWLRLVLITIAALAYGVIAAYFCRQYSNGYVGGAVAAVIVVLAWIGVMSVLTMETVGGQRLLAVFLAGFVFVGMSVNPIQYSSAAITDQPISNEVITIQNAQPGVWAVDRESTEGAVGQLLAANGVTTLNAVHVTPDLDLWHTLDPEGTYEDIYNRYACINITVTNEHSKALFELIRPDRFALNATPEDLEKLGVDYVLSSQPLDQQQFSGYRFEKLGDTIHTWTPYKLVKTQ